MTADTQVKLAIYQHFAETGVRPSPREVAERAGCEIREALDAYQRLCAQRLLVLGSDGSSIRMASPFSGIPTQHVVESDGVRYFANNGGNDALLSEFAAVLQSHSCSIRMLLIRECPENGN